MDLELDPNGITVWQDRIFIDESCCDGDLLEISPEGSPLRTIAINFRTPTRSFAHPTNGFIFPVRALTVFACPLETTDL